MTFNSEVFHKTSAEVNTQVASYFDVVDNAIAMSEVVYSKPWLSFREPHLAPPHQRTFANSKINGRHQGPPQGTLLIIRELRGYLILD